MRIEIQNSPSALQQWSRRWKAQAEIALVPTMGCLHEGHLSLVHQAKGNGRKVVASIFVNPLQFGPNEDFAAYPRTFDDDARKLEAAGVDVVFAPQAHDFYPAGFSTSVKVGGLDKHLCGPFRPGHFEGVATVVLKLFQSSLCDVAIFGEKDFQQLRVIERMVSDLNLPVRVLAGAIVRESDGLAMSSRNRYLTTEQRQSARRIPEAGASSVETVIKNPGVTVGTLVAGFKNELSSVPLTVDYIEVAEESDLIPAPATTVIATMRAPRLFVVARAGKTRLLDNFPLKGRTP